MSRDIEQEVISAVAETLRIEANTISKASRFTEDLGADSLDLVELIMALEAKFDCDIPDEDAGKIATVSDAVKYIQEHLNS
jgi:acyl carrier protein